MDDVIGAVGQGPVERAGTSATLTRGLEMISHSTAAGRSVPTVWRTCSTSVMSTKQVLTPRVDSERSRRA